MATKTLTTRIALKTDTTANWAASTLVLLKGEMAIEIPESGEYKLKIGDGVKTFNDLPYSAMTPTEVSNLVKNGAVQTVSLASGTNNGTLKLTVDGTATDNIAVKGLGSAAYTSSGSYAAKSHTHAISEVTNLQTTLNGKSNTGHTHDDRYYTETEMNTKLAAKANSSHTHGASDITSVNASAIQGVIDISHIPAGALERCVVVENDTKRFALTNSDVQKGDTVKVTATGKMYFVIDDTKLTTEDGYTVYTAGSATSVPWSGVTGKPSTYTPSAHKHVKADITDFPTSMPASDVYAWAKAATKPTYTKSEVGLGNVDNTADANKSVKYATSAGTATNVTSQGASTSNDNRHVWFSASNETQRAHSDSFKYNPSTNVLTTNISGNAATASAVAWGNVTGKPSTFPPSGHTHSIGNINNLQATLDAKAANSRLSNQDLNTVKTPGFYTAGGDNACTNKPSGVSNFGLIVIHRATGDYYTQICYVDNVSYRRCCVNGTWGSWTQDKLTDTNTWRAVQNNLTSDATDQSLAAAQGKALKALIDGKANSSHTHSISQITNLQSTLDGKAASSHTHSISNVTGLQDALNGKAASSHTHSISQITNLQTTLDGKSNTGHTHNYAGSNSAGGVAYNAAALYLNPSTRQTSLNYDMTSDTYAKRVTYSIATSSTTTGKPPTDAYVFTFGWDSNDGYGGQLAISNNSGHIYSRSGSSTTVNNKKATSWAANWNTILDSTNYTSYTVTKTGSGASGTWGISISGNAATATKATSADSATKANTAATCTGNAATATKLATARKIGNASFDGSADITLSAIGAASSGHTHNYAGSSSAGGAANSAVKLSTARNFSITGGATAAAISFDGSANVALNVTSVSTDVLNNGSNTLILSCGGAA